MLIHPKKKQSDHLPGLFRDICFRMRVEYEDDELAVCQWVYNAAVLS